MDVDLPFNKETKKNNSYWLYIHDDSKDMPSFHWQLVWKSFFIALKPIVADNPNIKSRFQRYFLMRKLNTETSTLEIDKDN